MKVDLRILCCANTNKPDITVGEFAKKATRRMLYMDKLKQVTMSKYDLDSLLLSDLSPSTTFIPLIQIMGFDCNVYILIKILEFYVLETVKTAVFPTSRLSLKENGIQKLWNCLERRR